MLRGFLLMIFSTTLMKVKTFDFAASFNLIMSLNHNLVKLN